MNSLRFAILLATTALLVGCSTIQAKDFKAKPQHVAVNWERPVEVTPVLREDGAARFNSIGKAFEMDLNEFSSVLSKLVNDSLSQSGATLAPGDRTLSVEVIRAEFMWMACLIDFTLTLGDGTKRGFQTSAASCRAAFEAAVGQIVSDPQTARYLGGT